MNINMSQTYNTDFIVNQQCIVTENDGTNCIDYFYDLDNLTTNAGSLTISREVQKAGLINGSTLDHITMVRTNNSFGEMSDEVTQFNTTTLLAANYLRDKLGRITQRTLNIQGTASTEVYGYNDAGRLATVTKGATITSYVFDANGNRLSKSINDGTNTTTTNGIYDSQDRLTSYGNCSYQYTANGELTKKTCGTDVTQYSYDVLGNLTQVTLPDNTKIDYLIDGLNRRIGKKVNDTLQQGFLYGDQLNPVAELDGSNNIISQFIYGTKVNVPDYMIKGGVTYQIITDQLGSPRLVVNASTGTVAQRMDYDEFGLITQDTNPGFQPFGFAGGLVDNQTGLTRFGARDYDAHTGRWTSKDPIRFAAGDSNIYGYVFSDPVNFIDPNGKIAWNVFGTIVGGALGAWNAYQRGDSIALGFVSGSVTGFAKGGTKTFQFIKGYLNSLLIQNSNSTIESVSHRQAFINGIIDASGITGKAAERLTKSLILQDLYKRSIKEIIQYVLSEINKDLSSNCR